jgi:hypothetical protein
MKPRPTSRALLATLPLAGLALAAIPAAATTGHPAASRTV